MAEQKAFSILTEAQRIAIEQEGENVSESLRTILDHAIELASASIGQIILLQDDELVIFESTQEDKGARIALNRSISGIAINRRHTINIKNLEEEIDPEYGPYKITSMVRYKY
ncbi:MAG: hypothetical protein R2867_37835 [Caldilineaceae bacterium]